MKEKTNYKAGVRIQMRQGGSSSRYRFPVVSKRYNLHAKAWCFAVYRDGRLVAGVQGVVDVSVGHRFRPGVGGGDGARFVDFWVEATGFWRGYFQLFQRVYTWVILLGGFLN